MIVPNKFINFDSSILSKLHLINQIDRKNIHLVDLYYTLQKNFDSLDEFLYFLDVLFILDYITIDFKKGDVAIC